MGRSPQFTKTRSVRVLARLSCCSAKRLRASTGRADRRRGGALRSPATCIVLQFGPFFNDCTSMKLSETQCLHIDTYIVSWLHYGVAVPTKQFPILVDWLPHQRSPIPAQHARDWPGRGGEAFGTIWHD